MHSGQTSTVFKVGSLSLFVADIQNTKLGVSCWTRLRPVLGGTMASGRFPDTSQVTLACARTSTLITASH